MTRDWEGVVGIRLRFCRTPFILHKCKSKDFAYFLGHATSIIQSLDSSRRQYREKVTNCILHTFKKIRTAFLYHKNHWLQAAETRTKGILK